MFICWPTVSQWLNILTVTEWYNMFMLNEAVLGHTWLVIWPKGETKTGRRYGISHRVCVSLLAKTIALLVMNFIRMCAWMNRWSFLQIKSRVLTAPNNLLTVQRGLGTPPWRREYSWSAWKATCSCICRGFFFQSHVTNSGESSASFTDFWHKRTSANSWYYITFGILIDQLDCCLPACCTKFT